MSGIQWKSEDNRSMVASDADSTTQGRTQRWANSIQSVLRENEEQWSRKEEEMAYDKFGEEVARILNQTPEFQGPQHYSSTDSNAFPPLLSTQNLHAIRQLLTFAFLIRLPATLLIRIWDACCFLTKNPKTLRSALLFFVVTMVMSLSLLVVVCHKVVVWLVRTTIKCAHFMVSLLIDVEELKRLCPERGLRLWTKIVLLAKVCDDFVLGGRKHAGREWNADAHLWKGNAEAQSRKEGIWKCPPPSAKLGRRRALDGDRLPREWSNDTKQHVLGINFCYILLREDYNRRQLKYERMVEEKRAESNARRAAFARAKSQAFDVTSLSQRGLISEEQTSCASTFPSEGISRYRRSVSTFVRPHAVMGELNAIELVGDSRPRALSEGDLTDSSPESADEASSASSIRSGYIRDDLSLVISPKRTRPSLSRDVSIRSDESDIDLDWLDVGTRIGVRLLNSEHVQKAVASQDTAEKIYDMSKKVESHLKKTSIVPNQSLENAKRKNDSLVKCDGSVEGRNKQVNGSTPLSGTLGLIAAPAKPMHSMWTSPAAAARQKSESSIGSISDGDDDSLTNGFAPPLTSSYSRLRSPDETRPPRSPHVRRGVKQPRDRNIISNKIASNEGMNQSVKVDDNNAVNAPPDIKRYAHASEPRDENSSISPPRLFAREGAPSHPRVDVGTAKSSASALKSVKPPSPKSSKQVIRRSNLQPGTKVVVPILPKQPGVKTGSSRVHGSIFQMATVVKSRRIHLRSAGRRHHSGAPYTNCLAVTVKLDKSFLRGADFAEMTFRVRDEWSSRYMPRHSKFPIGACVATSYGLGVLVAWRVEDDCHVIGSLWQHRGAGAAHAYLNRDSIHGVIEASVGFDVETNLGHGTVLAYTHSGKDFRGGRFFVHIKEGRSKDQVLEFARSNILSCLGAKFIPVIELLREAARYQLLVDRYTAALRQKSTFESGECPLTEEEQFWQTCSKGLELLWTSFLKVVEEDKDFDQGLSNIVMTIIHFLDSLDNPDGRSLKESDESKEQRPIRVSPPEEFEDEQNSDHETVASTVASSSVSVGKAPAGFWFMNDWFGGIFQDSQSSVLSVAISEVSSYGPYIDEVEAAKSDEYYRQAFTIVRSLMRTVSIARASCVDEPNLRLALSICYEFLLFVKTVLKVQQRNVTQQSLRIWKRALEEIADTLGPIKDRLQKIGKGVAERMEQHGKKAKVRILRFVDIVLSDERFMVALGRDDLETCIERVEEALVRSKIIDEASRVSYHKTIEFIYKNSSSSGNAHATARYGEKLAKVAAAMHWLSTPRRAFLTLLRSDAVLELMERLLIRVFRHDSFASRMLAIHASNFQSLRQLRMLKDFTIAGKLWIPILDAANDELHWAVSNMPENVRELMFPISQLFSLCVSQFHKLGDGDLTADWLNFLMKDEAVELINEIDVKLILSVQALCKDIKEVMVVLPYYPR